jgi:uncharacterized protein with HEPN domain
MTAESDRKEWHWVCDMLEAIEKIQTHPEFAKGKEAFNTDEYFQVWVLFHMERLGECASCLRRDHNYDQKHPDIDWASTQGMRRRIVHTYWKTDLELVWKGVEYLPTMKKGLEELLKEKEQNLELEKPRERGTGLPFPQPKNRLEELANKRAREKAVQKEVDGKQD